MSGIIKFLQLPNCWIFIVAIFFLSGSLIALHRQRNNIAIWTLFICALLVRIFMILQDPFFHDWDERFHALVARNMLDNPLSPFLIKFPIDGNHVGRWNCSHIWLHKQPLFLWEMALIMKLFGISIWSSRLPSVIMGAIMVPMVFNISSRLTNNKTTSWIAAAIFSFLLFQLEQISGVMGMDHNDVAFGFYILASIWAYSEYTDKNKLAFILLIGIFVGCAVLTKWLSGFLIFSGWATNILLNTKQKERKREILNLTIAALVAIAVFLPWQLYILNTFPAEAKIEYALNNRHITEVIENHGGTIFFYLDNFPAYFGEIGWIFVPAGFAVLLFQIKKNRIINKSLGISLLTCFASAYIFFSYVAMTKVIGYFFMVAPIGIILLAIALVETKRQLAWTFNSKAVAIIFPILVSAILVSAFNPEKLQLNHNPDNSDRINRIQNAQIYKNLKSYIPSNVKIVLNTNDYEDFTAMFYNNNLSVYSGLINKKIIDSLNSNHVPFAVFEDRDKYALPESITNSPTVFIIHKKLKPVLKY